MRFQRGWIIAGMVAVVIAGVAAVTVWHMRAAGQARPGDTVSLHEGRVTFRMPEGWRRLACPGDASGCVYLGTPRGADDAIFVIVVTPQPHSPGGKVQVAGFLRDPATLPGGRFFTVDGVRFARAHVDAVTAQPATTLVRGLLRNGDEVIMSCSETAEPALVRAGCEVVIGSLHLRQ